MEKTNQQKYLPFHAINEFMRDDYRLTILQEVLSDQSVVKAEVHSRIGRMISKGVQIPGFRNSNQAPAAIKVKHCVSLFERSPEFSALVIEAWSDLHGALKKDMWELLKSRGWNIPVMDADHSQLSGFQLDWNKADTFEVLIDEIKKKNPGTQESDDNISLMAVWIGNRLPYNLYDEGSKQD
jgi:hypothetical protein